MYIEDLEAIVKLEAMRKRAMRMFRALGDGSFGDFNVYQDGDKLDVWSVIEKEPIRAAMMRECSRVLSGIESEIGALGVNISQKLVKK